ncbi:uncharacterized protein CMC5_027840 [Chondromyces crocatus]|uniref:PDZ domain-containing protein n=2 Tax=Chondromyces crocatus TaxID=52 RepID=A0A0K1ED83_CHOCO|nr:uncharacterized protein CMC5_027840 [Chondromyces crocatus]
MTGAKTVHVALGMVAAGAAAIAMIHAGRGQDENVAWAAEKARPAEVPAQAGNDRQVQDPSAHQAETPGRDALADEPRPLRAAPPQQQAEERRSEREPHKEDVKKKGNARERVATLLSSGPSAALLQKGDAVLAVDGRSVDKAEALEDYLTSLAPGTAVLMEVMRAGERRFLGVQLSSAPPRPKPKPQRAEQTAPAASTHVVVVQPVPMEPAQVAQAPAGFFFGVGGDSGGYGMRPPTSAAPGLPQTPGATFAPGPGTSSLAYPQIPGVAQPPGFPGGAAFGGGSIPGFGSVGAIGANSSAGVGSVAGAANSVIGRGGGMGPMGGSAGSIGGGAVGFGVMGGAIGGALAR